MAVTEQGLQLYFVAPVEILSCDPTLSFARSAADTVAVTVFPDLESAVMETEAVAPPEPGVMPVVDTVEALVMEEIDIDPVPSIASVMEAFVVSKALDESDRVETQPDPDGQ